MKCTLFLVALNFFAPLVAAQGAGSLTAEVHPPITVSVCTKAGGCTTRAQSVVLDSNWRWVHTKSGSTNCFSGNTWDATLCPDGKTCATNCVIDGVDYLGTYGISTSGNSLNLKFVTVHAYGTNVGSRVYLMNAANTQYEMLKLLNQELSFDVDVSNLPCGLNGALYLSEMAADGGASKYPTNTAGAKFGTGYCDAQCPHDIKFIGGEANVGGWISNPLDPNAGTGAWGSCCAEMDIWEANSVSTAYTPHPCSEPGDYRCTGTACGDGDNRYGGVCDKDGCDFNAYRMGDKSFYGPGKTLDTTKVMTVVTQFITSDGTANGDLVDIRRVYKQNGVVVQNAKSIFPELVGGPYDSVSTNSCTAQKALFNDNNHFARLGGLKKMGEAMKRGMVLVMSIWDDYAARMLWLDAVAFPVDADPSVPGIARGTCATTSGQPKDVEANSPNSNVRFSNIKWGEIGSTNAGITGPGTGTTTTTTAGVTTTTTTTTRTTTTSSATSTTCAAAATVTVTSPAQTVYVTVTAGQQTTTTTTRVPTTTTTTTSTGTNCAQKYGQCGGIGFNGPTCCVASTCTKNGDYYSQCL